MISNSELLSTARVARLSLAKESGQFLWDGFCDLVKESCGGTLPATVHDLMENLEPSLNQKFIASLQSNASGSGELEFALRTGNQTSGNHFKFYRAPHSTEIFIYCLEGSSSEKRDHSSDVASRLKLGMAEAHHRVKNSLQNVISYVNVMMSDKKQLDATDIHKLICYIHALSSLHDILLEEVKNNNAEGKTVRIERILTDVLVINSQSKSIEWGEIPELVTTPRRAATLSLILNELLVNAAKFGTGVINVSIALDDQNAATLTVENELPEQAATLAEQGESRGLHIVKLLAKADLQSPVDVSSGGGRYSVKLRFPLESRLPSQS